MAPVFTPGRCDLPEIERLPLDPFITDCSVPAAPDPIRACRDMNAAVTQLQQSIQAALPGGGGGDEEDECPVVVAGSCGPIGEYAGYNPGEFQIRALKFNGKSSFYLWTQPSDECPDKFDVVLDIGGGPSDSVFWQPPGGGSPLWTQCPKLGHSLTIGTTSNGWLFLQTVGGGTLGLSADGEEQYWKGPTSKPRSAATYLFAEAVSGNCVKLGWSYQGVSGSFTTYEGTTVTVKGGLITGISPGEQIGTDGDATCIVTPCLPFKPC